MSNERRFAAVNTKIRVLESKALRNNDYINLIKKETVESQINYLKENTIYNLVLDDAKTIQEAEFKLKKHMLTEFEKLLFFFTDDYKNFFKAILMRYEVEDLKLYLRILQRNEDLSKINHFQLVTESHSSINFKDLSTATSLSDVVEKLRGTPYYKVLNPYRQEEESKILFYMEMNLDRLYFNNLKDKSMKLSSEDNKIFNKILGKNIDLLNIEWIYRGIKYYDLIPEELINFTLPNGLEFNYQKIKEMCYSSEDRLKEVVMKTQYKFLFDSEKDIDLYMGRRIERYIYFGIEYKDLTLNPLDLLIFLDTSPDQGNRTNPYNTHIETENGSEFIIQIKDKGDSKVVVDSYYDLHYYQYGKVLHMIPENPLFENKDSGLYNPIKLGLNKEITIPKTKQTIPFNDYETGILRLGNGNPESKDYDSLADYYVNKKDNFIEIRIPWLLVGFTDPSTKEIIGDIYLDGIESRKNIDGIRLSLAAYDTKTPETYDSFPRSKDGKILGSETILYTWDEWNEPIVEERLKKSYYILKDKFGEY